MSHFKSFYLETRTLVIQCINTREKVFKNFTNIKLPRKIAARSTLNKLLIQKWTEIKTVCDS